MRVFGDEEKLSNCPMAGPTFRPGFLEISHGTRRFSSLNRWKGRRGAAFWRQLGFPNLLLARAALANKVRRRRLEEWKREELRRTPFAILNEPPDELRPNNGTKWSKHLATTSSPQAAAAT